jgi:hypothetical protein
VGRGGVTPGHGKWHLGAGTCAQSPLSLCARTRPGLSAVLRDWPQLVHAVVELFDEGGRLDLLGGWCQEFAGDV